MFPTDIQITKRDADLGLILAHYLQDDVWLIHPRIGYKSPVWGEIIDEFRHSVREERIIVLAFGAARRAISEYKEMTRDRLAKLPLPSELDPHANPYDDDGGDSEKRMAYQKAISAADGTNGDIEALETLLDLPKMKRALEVASLYLTDPHAVVRS